MCDDYVRAFLQGFQVLSSFFINTNLGCKIFCNIYTIVCSSQETAVGNINKFLSNISMSFFQVVQLPKGEDFNDWLAGNQDSRYKIQ